jgi:hypothetical protein
MTAPLSIPVTITPQAAARVAELGAPETLDRMLEKASECIPGLLTVCVILVPDPEEGADPAVVLHAQVDPRVGLDNPGRWTWRRWLTDTYLPDFYRHFTLLMAPGGPGRVG